MLVRLFIALTTRINIDIKTFGLFAAICGVFAVGSANANTDLGNIELHSESSFEVQADAALPEIHRAGYYPTTVQVGNSQVFYFNLGASLQVFVLLAYC